jgi:hypothetical protein
MEAWSCRLCTAISSWNRCTISSIGFQPLLPAWRGPSY